MIPCTKCNRRFRNGSGLKRHYNTMHEYHPGLDVPMTEFQRDCHPFLTGAHSDLTVSHYISVTLTGNPCISVAMQCNEDGEFLAIGTAPELPPERSQTDWSPFNSRVGFELADFVFTEAELSKKRVNRLFELTAATLVPHGVPPPISDHTDLLRQIDSIPLGNVPWECFCLSYDGPLPETAHVPEWMTTEYEIWFRDPRAVIKGILSNPEFDGHIDYSAYREFEDSQRRYCNMMSGDWTWRQSVCHVARGCALLLLIQSQDIIAEDPSTHGSMFVPIILGSDKTTVSVATGQNEFYPLYLSIGNIQNHMRRAHKNALVVIGFLPIPKGTVCSYLPMLVLILESGARKDTDKEGFRQFKRTLTHDAIANILLPVKPFMTTPDIVRCPDQHFRRVLYGLGPHISDYPEQAMASWILLNWCPTYVRPHNLLIVNAR
jgi:hypothetical protein